MIKNTAIIVSIAAKNIHKSLAPWCLKAFADVKGDFDTQIYETNINELFSSTLANIYKIATNINAKVLGFSCYIYNIDYVKKLLAEIKKLLPNIFIVLGGPEMQLETTTINYPQADKIIVGQGEVEFYNYCCKIFDIKKNAKFENFEKLPTPFTSEYFSSFASNQIPTITNQLVYFESTRGCPYKCSYCLSATLNQAVCVRNLDDVKKDLIEIVKNGATTIKFVDRTFNYDVKRAYEILVFVKELNTNCTFHFEIAAHLLDDATVNLIKQMPKGRVQFEIGIQSTNLETLKAINRTGDLSLTLENIKKLTALKNCHIHIDLIVGLMHDDINSIISAINTLADLNADMLQLGFLKLLKGAPYYDPDAVFTNCAPYEILKTKKLSFDDVIQLKKIESIIDKFYNTTLYKNIIDYIIKTVYNAHAYDFFNDFYSFLTEYNGNNKLSLKGAYTAIMQFLLQKNADFGTVKQLITLDCNTNDIKALPNELK